MALIEKHGEALIIMGKKHYGKTIQQVVREDPKYLIWLRSGDRLHHVSDDVFFAIDTLLEQFGYFKK